MRILLQGPVLLLPAVTKFLQENRDLIFRLRSYLKIVGVKYIPAKNYSSGHTVYPYKHTITMQVSNRFKNCNKL